MADGSDSDSDSSDEETVKRGKVVDISDEALFAACGGMTGHKGARHGINMSAKLDRIKMQEAEGLRKMKLIYQNSQDSGLGSPQEGMWDIQFIFLRVLFACFEKGGEVSRKMTPAKDPSSFTDK